MANEWRPDEFYAEKRKKTGAKRNKQSLYFTDDMLREIHAEAARLDRTFSWVVQRAWLIARAEVAKFQNPDDVGGAQ